MSAVLARTTSRTLQPVALKSLGVDKFSPGMGDPGSGVCNLLLETGGHMLFETDDQAVLVLEV